LLTAYYRASSFLYLGLGAAVGGLGGPLVSGVLMNSFGPWVPIFIVVSLTPFLFVLIMLIPETLAIDVKQQNGYGRQQQSISQQVSRGLRDMKESLKILKNTNVALLLVTFFFSNARFSAASSTLAQYISKHFGWTLAETSILLSPLGLITITMLALLPRLSDILISPRVGLSTFKKDLYLTRTALCIQFVAAIIQGLSRGIAPFIVGLVIGSFGGVESPLARATISHFVEPMYTSRLHAVIGMAETLGAIVGGPVLAICFTKGLELKGFWTGLPWFYIAVVSTVCLSAMAFVRQPRLRYGEDESEADGYRAPDNPIHLD
jgi:MFS family permease